MSYGIEYSGTFPLASGVSPEAVRALADAHGVSEYLSRETLLAHREIEVVDGAIDGVDGNAQVFRFLKDVAPMLAESYRLPGSGGCARRRWRPHGPRRHPLLR